MDIIDNKAVLVTTRKPEKITEVIEQSKVIEQVQTPNGVGYRVAVKWTLRNAKLLQMLGFKKVPSPIEGQYNWPGMYKPFDHQKKTASFLTLHQRAYCFNEQGCVDSETEYLSPTGWVKISEYTGGRVAQYHPDTRSIEFVEPEAYVKKECESMIHFKTKYGIDQMLSPEHRMLVHDDASKEGKWVVMSAEEMKLRHDFRLVGVKLERDRERVSFSHAATPVIYKREWGHGLRLSEADLRVQVAVIADGHYPNSTTYCTVRLKKERKISRLRKLLNSAAISYKEKVPEYAYAKGFHVFTFYAPLRTKEFDSHFYKCNQQQIDAIYDEVLNWDGCLRKGGRLGEFTSTSKASADFVQAVFNSKGHIARITECRNESKYKQGVCYTVVIREQGNGLLSYKSTAESATWVQSTDGFKYCFTVPTSFLLFRRNGCVFASGNTGKTMSVAWALDYLMTKKVIKRALIICPLSIMDTAWRADLFKSVMHRRVDIAYGSAEKRIQIVNSDAEIVVINYDGCKTIRKALAAAEFDVVVCDEGTALKNPSTDRWKDINTLITPKTWLWLLTGTPAAQSPVDAYGLAKIMNPRSVPSHAGAFKDQVMYKVSTFRWIPKPDAQQKIHQLLQPAIRFTKEQCLDLPERLYEDREVPLTPQQKKYYDILKRDALIQAAGEEITAVNAAVAINKLLQLSSGAMYSDTKEVVEFDCSHKMNEMLSVINESSHKTLVFANFTHSIAKIQEFLDKHKISNDTIHGGVPVARRTEIINKFQMTPEPRVLVIQPQAAAHGITLHAANTVIWFGPVTSVEVYLQANDRVHRAGQKNACTVVHLISSEVEKRLYRALGERKLAQSNLLSMYKNLLGVA